MRTKVEELCPYSQLRIIFLLFLFCLKNNSSVQKDLSKRKHITGNTLFPPSAKIPNPNRKLKITIALHLRAVHSSIPYRKQLAYFCVLMELAEI